MIQVYFNEKLNCFQAYANGVLLETLNIKIESDAMDIPRAQINAFVEIVNFQPGKEAIGK
jgi:hypothetical protein